MEDDNSKEDHNQASTSKKHSENNISGEDAYDDSADGRSTISQTSVSATYSTRLNMAHPGQEIPQPMISKKESKREKKKKRSMGRVEKRKRPVTKRQVTRKMPKRKPRVKGGRRVRDLSISTIFSRHSSNPTSQALGCDYCGHRCCRRRYEYERKKRYRQKRKPKRNQYLKKKTLQRAKPEKFSGAENIQVGSRCMMLSPLCIDTKSSPIVMEEHRQMHCEVSPEMIEESLRRLTMWKQDVQTEILLEYLMRNYPVNTDKGELLEELLEKLRLAMIVGIVTQAANGCWSLSHAFQKRRLAKTHVSLFWKIYADTMKPVVRKDIQNVPKPQAENATNTRAVMRLYDEKYI